MNIPQPAWLYHIKFLHVQLSVDEASNNGPHQSSQQAQFEYRSQKAVLTHEKP